MIYTALSFTLLSVTLILSFVFRSRPVKLNEGEEGARHFDERGFDRGYRLYYVDVRFVQWTSISSYEGKAKVTTVETSYFTCSSGMERCYLLKQYNRRRFGAKTDDVGQGGRKTFWKEARNFALS